MQEVKQKLRVITHGNNGFKSSQLLNRMHHSHDDIFETEDVEFFPFSDQNLFERLSPIRPNPALLKLIEKSEKDIEISAILVLISQTEIFSDGMNTLIGKLAHNSFYQNLNEKDWWKHVILVFSFGENVNGNEKAVKRSIAGNKGIKELVKKTGNRYIWVSNMTAAEEINEMLQRKLKKLKEEAITFPGTLLYQNNEKIYQAQQSQLPPAPPPPLVERLSNYQEKVDSEEFEFLPISDLNKDRKNQLLPNLIMENLKNLKFLSIRDLDLFPERMIILALIDNFFRNDETKFPKKMPQLPQNNNLLYLLKLLKLVPRRCDNMNHSKCFHLIPYFEANPNMTQKYQINVPLVIPEECTIDITLPAEQGDAKREKQKQSNCKRETTKDEIITLKDEESQIEVEKEDSTEFQTSKSYQDMADLIHKSLNCNQDENKELHHLFSLNNIEIEMREILIELNRIGSTKARVVVINFEEMQTEEIYLKLLYLSKKNNDFNICTLIAFKIQGDIEKSINDKIPKRFNRLVEAASSRYIFLIEPNRNFEKKQKLPSDQHLQNSIYYNAKIKEDENASLALKKKLKENENSELNQTFSDSKIFLSHNFVFSSNEPNQFLFSYFLLDTIRD